MTLHSKAKFDYPFADTSTPFDVTLATADTAEDLVAVPGSKLGRQVSLRNEGPGDAAIAFDDTATVNDFLLLEGDEYAGRDLEINTNISLINVTTAAQPRVRGILWSGD